jgi:hypothetical protein
VHSISGGGGLLRRLEVNLYWIILGFQFFSMFNIIIHLNVN